MLESYYNEKYYMNKLNNNDLTIWRSGIENCEPSHFWGPAVRDTYILHYILEGKGTFQISNNTYELEKGQGFLIYPNEVIFYQADSICPWSYSWIAFCGVKAELYLKKAGLCIKNPIFEYKNDDYLSNILNQMVSMEASTNSQELNLLSHLYLFLSKLIEINETNPKSKVIENHKEIYLNNCIKFIELNYSRKISIAELAKHNGLDRSYVYSIFKSYMNISPQEFLINFKIAKACELLENRLLTLGDVSRSVGYSDTLLFSKVFKRIKGVSPREFRQKNC